MASSERLRVQRVDVDNMMSIEQHTGKTPLVDAKKLSAAPNSFTFPFVPSPLNFSELIQDGDSPVASLAGSSTPLSPVCLNTTPDPTPMGRRRGGRRGDKKRESDMFFKQFADIGNGIGSEELLVDNSTPEQAVRCSSSLEALEEHATNAVTPDAAAPKGSAGEEEEESREEEEEEEAPTRPPTEDDEPNEDGASREQEQEKEAASKEGSPVGGSAGGEEQQPEEEGGGEDVAPHSPGDGLVMARMATTPSKLRQPSPHSRFFEGPTSPFTPARPITAMPSPVSCRTRSKASCPPVTPARATGTPPVVPRRSTRKKKASGVMAAPSPAKAPWVNPGDAEEKEETGCRAAEEEEGCRLLPSSPPAGEEAVEEAAAAPLPDEQEEMEGSGEPEAETARGEGVVGAEAGWQGAGTGEEDEDEAAASSPPPKPMPMPMPTSPPPSSGSRRRRRGSGRRGSRGSHDGATPPSSASGGGGKALYADDHIDRLIAMAEEDASLAFGGGNKAKVMNSPVEKGGAEGGRQAAPARPKTARELHEELWCADPKASVLR